MPVFATTVIKSIFPVVACDDSKKFEMVKFSKSGKYVLRGKKGKRRWHLKIKQSRSIRSINITKSHILETKRYARDMDMKYGAAIVKFDGEKTYVSDDNLPNLKQFLNRGIKGGIYKKVKIVKVG